jgi:L-alanine-DL-glutamate epimerase-like enolase superfamily enzyme
MIRAKTIYREFRFQRPATTSRGTFLSKKVHFILLYHTDDPSSAGIGECSLFPGLSHDNVKGFKEKLNQTIERINQGDYLADPLISEWPSISFALETAWKDLRTMGSKILYPSDFTEGKDGIDINGLIWMDNKEEMIRQIRQKMADGFTCLKMKIGALDLEEEFEVLKFIRSQCSSDDLEIRVDANGAFRSSQALEIIKMLSDFELHSIEQPITPGHPDAMAKLCELSPVPVALDEELIGKLTLTQKRKILDTIKPHYLVLKPGLLGGVSACKDWIDLTAERNIGWWITSALETNVGLNAIAQWTYTLKKPVYHGLSTGSLFINNIASPLYLSGEKLYYDPDVKWNITALEDQATT